MAHIQILVDRWGPRIRIRRFFADGLNNNFSSSVAQARKLQSATKWVETLCLWTVGFLPFTGFKRRKNSFSSPIFSMQCSADVRATYRKKNKHPKFEWKGQGRGADSFVLWSYPIWAQCLNNFVADCRWVMYQFRRHNVPQVLPSNYFFFLRAVLENVPKTKTVCSVWFSRVAH